MIRTFCVEAKSKDRIRVRLRAEIVSETGTLTRDEVDIFKTRLADNLMQTLANQQYLHVGISEMKVTR